MNDKEFNLLEEPWIRVMTMTGSVKECSLKEALINSHEYRRMAGELPTQDIALLRLMLAVLQTVVYRVDEDGNKLMIEKRSDALKRWKTIWEAGKLPKQEIEEYLDSQKEKFWLFHPKRPFYQVPEAENGTKCSSSKLDGEISESNNKKRLFPNKTGYCKENMSYSQAARWLVYLNAYDDTSAKPKQKGLPAAGAGWLGKLGLIYAEGNNLFQTLMLNLVLVHDKTECWDDPHPTWEMDEAKKEERTEISIPNNQAELLTLQSRRLLLERKEDCVTGYKVLGGDFFEKTDAFNEQMTLWKKVEDKANKMPHMVPKRHSPEKQMWREFSNIIINPADGCRPGIVEWVTLLKMTKAIDKEFVVRFRIAAVNYGDKDFFVTDVFGDYLDFHASLLTDSGMVWVRLINDEIERCDDAAKIIGRLATDIAKAAGDSQNDESRYYKEKFYYEIDIPFRKWLVSIKPEDDNLEQFEDIQKVWLERAYKIALKIGSELICRAGDNAFAGRSSEDGKYYSSPKAYNFFRKQIGKCFEKNKTVQGGET